MQKHTKHILKTAPMMALVDDTFNTFPLRFNKNRADLIEVVFKAIETTPSLRLTYEQALEKFHKAIVNQWIAKYTAARISFPILKKQRRSSNCKLIGGFSYLLFR